MLVSCTYVYACLGFLGDFFLRIGEREEKKTLVCVFGRGFVFV
jgi:hypothetical protein